MRVFSQVQRSTWNVRAKIGLNRRLGFVVMIGPERAPQMPNTVCGMTKVLMSLRVKSHNVFRKASAAFGLNGFDFFEELCQLIRPERLRLGNRLLISPPYEPPVLLEKWKFQAGLFLPFA